MRLLLDTHAVLWWLEGNSRLSEKARVAIRDAVGEVGVSAASAWEIATKHRLGRLPLAPHLSRDFIGYVDRAGFDKLSVTFEHALRAGALATEHRDPFDRLIAAQAEIEGMTIVTLDPLLRAFGVPTLW
jgi:PIN domain nuclease of toxin-antitoxin system